MLRIVLRTFLSPHVTPAHFVHPHNHVPHFPGCVGHVDTFPVRAYQGPGLYSGKYGMPVYKFQVTCTNLGAIAEVSGPYKGAKNDTKIFRASQPQLPPGAYLLADKAYISVPHLLPPIKENNARYTMVEIEEFNRIHGHYRSRVEHCVRTFKAGGCLAERWRSHDTKKLHRAVKVLGNIRSMYVARRVPYPPHNPQ